MSDIDTLLEEIDETLARAATEPPAEAKAPISEYEILEDEKGKFILHDGVRIPVRNGGPIGDPLEDWQTAREVAQDIESGSGIHAPAFGWGHLFGAVWRVTSKGGWTTYTLTPEWPVACWLASLPTVWIPYGLWLSWNAAQVGGLACVATVLLGWAAPFVAWSGWITHFGESDASIAKMNAAAAKAAVGTIVVPGR